MGEGSQARRLGKYELLGELGRGGMGIVYRAYDHVLEREVALKMMVAPDADKAHTVRFLREARTAGGLHHPNIVTIHELGQETGAYFIAMELLEGRNLRAVLASGQLPPIERRLEILARVCDGLDFAHRAGIVHRDVKPANVFLLNSGAIKILDFGIAKIVSSDNTRTGLVLGTVDYMSPEQVRAKKTLDGRADIFSAGVILYELLFRKPPFAAQDLGAALHRILHEQPPGYSLFDKVLTPELGSVLRRSLDKRCEARFARAGEMADALDGAAEAMRGRAGTELEERIEEVVAAGLLERDAPSVALEESDPEAETKDLRSARVPVRSVAVDPGGPSRRKRRIVIGAALALVPLALALILGRSLLDRQEPTPIVQQEPEDRVAIVPAPQREADEPEETEPTAAVEPEPEPTPAPAAAVETIPIARAVGAVSLRIMPWAHVDWIEDLETGERRSGEATTPVRLELPAGRYRLRLVNPYASRSLELDTTVVAGETTLLRQTLPGFDAAGLAREILAVENGERGRR